MNQLILSVIGAKGPTTVASLALVSYDHVLTIKDEIQTLWVFPPNAAGVLLLITRYSSLLIRVVDLLLFFRESWSPQSCDILQQLKFPGLGTIITTIFAHVIMVLRIYALYGGHATTLCLLLFFVVIEAALFALSLFNGFGTPRTLNPGCVTGAVFPVGINCIYWGIPLVAETVIFALTLRKCNSYAKTVKQVPFLKTFLRDGFLYYIILASTHVLNLLLFALASNPNKASGSGFGQTLTSILVSRLVFNLRKQSLTNDSCQESCFTQTQTQSWYFTSARHVDSMYTLFNVGNPQNYHLDQQEAG